MFKARRWKIILMIAIGSLLPVLMFQNCAKTTLEKVIPPEITTTELALKASLCNENLDVNLTPSKYIFVIDMSGSNLGGWTVLNGQTYWDLKTATDTNGDRFTAIKNFIENCGSQSGKQFAIIGFSNDAGVLSASTVNYFTNTVETYKADGTVNTVGAVKFKDSATALTDLQKLTEKQTKDLVTLSTWDVDKLPSPTSLQNLGDVTSKVIMRSTSYNTASSMVARLIQNDMAITNSMTDVYHIFFISDGTPDDGKNPSISNPLLRGLGCNKMDGVDTYNNYQKWIPHLKDVGFDTTKLTDTEKTQLNELINECYLYTSMDPMFTTRTLALTKGKNILFHGMFYGGDGSTPLVLDQLSKEGGTDGVIKLDSFAADQSVLCKLVSSKTYIQMKPTVSFALPLTTLRKGGHLLVDSDLDGVPDSEEDLLGASPTNPHSLVAGVMDGICARLGGKVPCEEKRKTIVCNESLVNPMGMTQCDFKMLELDKLTGTTTASFAIDTDKDGVPDWVEILKGTDPAVNEMNEDIDHDGISTYNEILKGTDPYSPDANLPEDALNLTSVTPDASLCEQKGGVQLSISRIQSLPLLACDQCGDAYNHKENEQVIMLIYRLTPLNTVEKNSEFRFKTVIFNTETKTFLNLTTPLIDPTNFNLLGSLL